MKRLSLIASAVLLAATIAFVAPQGQLPEFVTLSDGTEVLVHREPQRLYLKNQPRGGTFGKATVYRASNGELMANIAIASYVGLLSPSLPADEHQKQQWREVFGS